MIYPWQNSQWNNIMQRKNTLPHAILLRGRVGVGKHDFALHLAHALLCQQASHEGACGVCASCIWLKEGNHPDFKLVTPEDETDEGTSKKKINKKTQISVAQVRQLSDFLSLSSHQVQGRRIIVISPAEALNLASANALLKMLEEPPANTLFLLVASQPQRLLPTIISRCQVLDFSIPQKADAVTWLTSQGLGNPEVLLAYAGGAPLTVLQMQDQLASSEQLIQHLSKGERLDPSVSAPLFLAEGMERAIDVIQKWAFDLLSYQLTQRLHYHAQHILALQALCKRINLVGILAFQRSLIEAKKAANHPLSNEMQLEKLLVQYTQVFVQSLK
jgi:DNA polymerase III subunit delta'